MTRADFRRQLDIAHERTRGWPDWTRKEAGLPVNEIMDEPTTMPCLQCGGKGSFLIVERPDKPGGSRFRYVYDNTHINRTTVKGDYVDHYFCGACDGKGVVDVPGVKR